MDAFKFMKKHQPFVYRSELSWAKLSPGGVAQDESERDVVFQRLASPNKNYLKLAEQGQLPAGYAAGSATSLEHEIEVCLPNTTQIAMDLTTSTRVACADTLQQQEVAVEPRATR
jgi:hypothetical protein